jgi:hypothetical protein
VSGASHTFDPVAAAEDDIAGSKALIASAADDLSQHYRWLESYRASERRAARRLKRKEMMYQLELGRRRLVRSSEQFALTAFRIGLAVAVVLLRWGGTAITYLRALLQSGAAWLIPRVRALGFALVRWTAAAFSWTLLNALALARAFLRAVSIGAAWADRKAHAFAFASGWWLAASYYWTAPKVREAALALRGWLAAALSWTRVNGAILARTVGGGISTGFSWTVMKSDTIGVAFRKQVAIGFTRGRLKARGFGRTFRKELLVASRRVAAESSVLSAALQRRVSAGMSRTAVQGHDFALAFLKTTTTAGSWIALRSREFSLLRRRVESQKDPGNLRHRALVLRPCTALICVEPWRARLPVTRAG